MDLNENSKLTDRDFAKFEIGINDINLSKMSDIELEKLYKDINNYIEYLSSLSDLPLKQKQILNKKINILISKELIIKELLSKRNILINIRKNYGKDTLTNFYRKLVELCTAPQFRETIRIVVDKNSTDLYQFNKENKYRNIEKVDGGYRVYFYKSPSVRLPVSEKFFIGNNNSDLLIDAMKWRDEEEERLILNGDLIIIKFPYRLVNNKGKRAGINKVKSIYWNASWVENGEQKYELFSIREFGKKGAKNKALEFRIQKEKEMLQEYKETLKNIGISDNVIDHLVKKHTEKK